MMTIQQAADILNVSPSYLMRLLDAGMIPCEANGEQRRLKLKDVLAFKRQRDLERDAKLDELVKLTEEFGGYDEPPPLERHRK